MDMTEIPTHANDAIGDAEILAAWENRKTAIAAFNALPDELRSDSGQDSPDERRLQDEIDRAETTITEAVATTAAGIEAQLWAGLYHLIGSTERDEDDAIVRGDLEYLDAAGDRLDSDVRLVLSAIRSLRTMGA